jgi:hypothetical protein
VPVAGSSSGKNGTAGPICCVPPATRSSKLYSPLFASSMFVTVCFVWPKNAASDWKCVCFHAGSRKWSWHWAQSMRSPRNARVTRIASFSASGPLRFSSNVAAMKFTAGLSVFSPCAAIIWRTISA